jgi:hypothetical protein
VHAPVALHAAQKTLELVRAKLARRLPSTSAAVALLSGFGHLAAFPYEALVAEADLRVIGRHAAGSRSDGDAPA